MSIMSSRYAGTCADCGKGFAAGTMIEYHRNAPRGKKAAHVDCKNVESAAPGDSSYVSDSYRREFGAAAVQNLKNLNARGISEIRTSGGTFYQNSRGRCEDAPCCGCCTC